MITSEALVVAVLIGIGAGVLIDVNTNVLAGVMAALEFANSEPFEGFNC